MMAAKNLQRRIERAEQLMPRPPGESTLRCDPRHLSSEGRQRVIELSEKINRTPAEDAELERAKRICSLSPDDCGEFLGKYLPLEEARRLLDLMREHRFSYFSQAHGEARDLLAQASERARLAGDYVAAGWFDGRA